MTTNKFKEFSFLKSGGQAKHFGAKKEPAHRYLRYKKGSL